MISLGDISWINKNIDYSPLETNKLLFKLIFGELVRFNRKKLKSFTGFHLDQDSVKVKIAKVKEEVCICKLKAIHSLLSSEPMDAECDMAEFICILLNDVSKLEQQLLEYMELKKARSKAEDCMKSNQLNDGLKETSFQENQESSANANLILNPGSHAANQELGIIPINQESLESFALHSDQFPGKSSKKSRDPIVSAFTVNIRLEDLGCNLEAILDTGSPISFLNFGVLPKTMKFESYDDRYQFKGITGSKIDIIGKIKQMVVTQECEKQVCFYVLPNGIIYNSCLLGRDYLSQIVLTVDGGIPFISEKTE